MLCALEGELRGLLERIASGQESWLPLQGTTAWTRRIKERLCALGHTWGYKVSASDCEGADSPQSLFDLVLSRDSGDREPEHLFVMDTEWSPDRSDITWDFGELLLVDAALKLFVYQQPDQYRLAETTFTLDSRIRACCATAAGQRYLLAGYSWADHCFEYASVVV